MTCNETVLANHYRKANVFVFCDFYSHEIAPLKEITPDIPCTANLMDFFPGIDYFKFGKLLDRASWDNYPP